MSQLETVTFDPMDKRIVILWNAVNYLHNDTVTFQKTGTSTFNIQNNQSIKVHNLPVKFRCYWKIIAWPVTTGSGLSLWESTHHYPTFTPSLPRNHPIITMQSPHHYHPITPSLSHNHPIITMQSPHQHHAITPSLPHKSAEQHFKAGLW
jgi:hypothetical protein